MAVIPGRHWGTTLDRPLVIGAHWDTFEVSISPTCLHASFARSDPTSAKRQSKAACKMLVKSTPGNPGVQRQRVRGSSPHWNSPNLGQKESWMFQARFLDHLHCFWRRRTRMSRQPTFCDVIDGSPLQTGYQDTRSNNFGYNPQLWRCPGQSNHHSGMFKLMLL